MACVTAPPTLSSAGSSAVGTGQYQTLGRRPSGSPLPSVRERLLPPMPAVDLRGRLIGWAVPVLIAAVAGFVRFYKLGQPNAFVFDETYYPKDAFAMLHHGVPFNYVPHANEKIIAGANPVSLMTTPSFVVHPPLGKWLMAVSEYIFGMNPFGWRFVVALMGTISILMLGRIVRRLTRSDLLAGLAALLFSLDGLQMVMSRTGLLDLPMTFWMLAAVGALLIDRDWARARLADALDPATGVLPPRSTGPRMLLRPWRITAGVLFGASMATKWNGIYALAVFAVLSVAWDYSARRMVRTRHTGLTWYRFDAVPAFLSTVPVSLAVYLASWSGWLATGDGYDRTWADGHPAHGLARVVPAALRSLWQYHREIFNFNVTLTADHPYKSSAWSWLIIGRPVAFYSEYPVKKNCPTRDCVTEVLGIGTPVLWWAGTLAFVVAIVAWVALRDWRFGVPVLGLLATWVPWLPLGHRPIFYFYAIAIDPFMVMAITLVCGLILGPPGVSARRRRIGAWTVGCFTLAVLVNFAYFYPIFVADPLSHAAWGMRMWFDRWI